MPEETTIDLNNTSSLLSPVGSIDFGKVDIATNAEIDYPPAVYPLSGPIREGRFLINTVWLDVESEAGKVVVSSSRFGVYGVGDTLGEAVNDVIDMLCALYEDLTGSEETLSLYYRNRLEQLRAILE